MHTYLHFWKNADLPIILQTIMSPFQNFMDKPQTLLHRILLNNIANTDHLTKPKNQQRSLEKNQTHFL